ncbi:DivIVA domain-containing protein [Clostridium neuense]|uniref:DivIVA domain-containing protein n=1 Tax=Clostridium neuense TaxID=1728934 RepID=A0ABW8THE2_9CLOT
MSSSRLTAMDITSKEFRRTLRGFDPDEVDEFLNQIADSYEEMYKENSNLKEKNVILKEKLEHYAHIEETIQNTLVLAQNAAEQAKQSAKKEAELMIRNANDSAQKIIDKANEDVVKINDDYDKIKQEFVKFRSKYRTFINAQMDMFNSLENEFDKNYSIATLKDEETINAKEIQNDNKEQVIKEEAKALNESEESFTNDLNEIKSFFVK